MRQHRRGSRVNASKRAKDCKIKEGTSPFKCERGRKDAGGANGYNRELVGDSRVRRVCRGKVERIEKNHREKGDKKKLAFEAIARKKNP